MTSFRASVALVALLGAGSLPLAGQARKPPPLSELEARARKDSLDAQGQSVAELEQRVRADSNDAQLHYELGAELSKQQRTAEARRALGVAVKIDPKFVNAWVALIRLNPGYKRPTLGFQLNSSGRFVLVVHLPSDSMRYLYRRVFLLNPLVDVIPGEQYPVPRGWEGAMARGMRAFRQDDWEEAARHFAAVIKQTTRAGKPDVTPPYALWYHALTQVEQGRYDVAIQNVERLLNTAFRDSTAYGRSEAFSHQYTLAYLHHLAGHLEEAARVYRVVLEDQLGLDLVHMRLAQVLEQLGRWDEAVAQRRYAANANPDDPSLIFDLGIALHNAGMNAEAEDVLRQALAANPREVRAHIVLGAVLQAQGKTEPARAEYQRFLELSPRRYETLIADARRRLGAP